MDITIAIADVDWTALQGACDAYNAVSRSLHDVWADVVPDAFFLWQVQIRILDRWTQEAADQDRDALIAQIVQDPGMLEQVRTLVATLASVSAVNGKIKT